MVQLRFKPDYWLVFTLINLLPADPGFGVVARPMGRASCQLSSLMRVRMTDGPAVGHTIHDGLQYFNNIINYAYISNIFSLKHNSPI